MKRLFLVTVLTIAAGSSGARSPALEPAHGDDGPPHVLFLVGDGGLATKGGPVMVELERRVQDAVKRYGSEAVTTVLLGDNLYPKGLDLETRLHATPIAAQLSAARESPIYVVPGNHDWDHSGEEGQAKARHANTEIRRWSTLQTPPLRVETLPGKSCPAPEVRDVGGDLRLIFLDTQWFLHKKWDAKATYCPKNATPPLSALRESVSQAKGRKVLIFAHHPLRSGSHHAGHFAWWEHIFPLTMWKKWLWVPLPVLGTLGLESRYRFTTQDLDSKLYAAMRESVAGALKDLQVFAWVAGHDHGLQALRGAKGEPIAYHLVSGGASLGKRSYVRKLDSTLLRSSRNGFLELHITPKSARLIGHIVRKRGAEAVEVQLPFGS